MRERLLAAFLSLTLLTVLLYGVPRAFVRADVVNDEARGEVARSAAVVAEVIAVREEAGLPLDDGLDRLVSSEDQVVLRIGDDVRVLTGARAPSPDDVVAVAPVGALGGQVEVRRPGAVVRQDVVRALRPIVLVGLLALGVAALAGILLAGRLARPFTRLAEQAARLGQGEFDVDLPRQRVREAESIALALRDSSARLATMIARERGFARNASHQLRTPLTGMRLRVEDLTMWPETPPAVRAELEEVLGEVDRLAETVTALLSFAREGGTGAWEPVVLANAMAGVVERWQPLAAQRGRDVVLGDVADARLLLPRIAVEQVLDVLVDNALKHGRGTVGVAASVDGRSVRLVVTDEGAVPPSAEGTLLTRRAAASSSGEGIGLSLSADLAAAIGGRLRVVRADPTTLELSLPVVTAD